MNPNPLEQQAAVSSLATLMSISPGDTYIEFEKVHFVEYLFFISIYRNLFSFLIIAIFLFLKKISFFSHQHLNSLPDRSSHDMLSEIDIQVGIISIAYSLSWLFSFLQFPLMFIWSFNSRKC